MKLLKYNSYLLVLLFFFFIIPKTTYTWDLGIKAGFSFQSFYADGKNNAKEQSGFGADSSIFGAFLLHPRIILLAEGGFSHYGDFYSPYVGVTLGFVIYPEYLPFLGFSVREHFYNKIFSDENKWNTSIYFTTGSKLFTMEDHSIWMFFEYLVFQSLYKEYNSSRFSLNLAYSYDF